jgi:ABC-type polysaccharide/polyol phosphate transport system ATPase subunit
MPEPAVELSNVSKVYRRGAERANIRAALPGSVGRRSPRNGHWALRDLSMMVEPEEIVGIIGPNGAGKSTLLKLLARVIAPTEGRVVTRGRVASLIELGVGFHPDLTGSDNVRFSAAVLGMSRQDVKRHYDDIVQFAGIESFMGTPVKRYSSGMLARLGFAVASHLDANIVLVDEVLSVGDVEFQRRGFRRMEELRSQGATILLVTHNLWLVPEICQRALRLEHGRVVDQGDPAEVVERYQASAAEQIFGDADDGSNAVFINRYQLSKSVVAPGDSLDVEFVLNVLRPIPNSRVTVVITSPQGLHAAGTDVAGSEDALMKAGTWRLNGRVDSVGLSEGTYRVLVTVVERHSGVLLTHAQASVSLAVKSGTDIPQYGVVHLDTAWDVVPEQG